MSITVTGTVVDEAGTGLDGLTVEARGDWLLTTEQLATDTTHNGGQFTLVLKGVVGAPTHPASFRVRVVDGVGRPVCDDKEVAGTAGDQAIGRITVRDKDRTGLLVTNLKGEARFVSDGNALTVLIDGEEVFGRIVADIDAATAAPLPDNRRPSIAITQLFFGVPDFDPDVSKEHSQLVFDFGTPPIVPLDPLPSGQTPAPVPRPNDRRPERQLLEAAAKNASVRVLLNEPRLSWPEGVFWLAVLTPAAAGLGVGAIGLIALAMGVGFALLPVVIGVTLLAWIAEAIFIPRVLGKASDVKELRAYLDAGIARIPPPRGDITVRAFPQEVPDNGVLHCKMVIVNGERAVVIGSPFSQRYFDDTLHAIDNPERGNTTADIVHDVSVAVVGPAARDLHETFRLYWNEKQTPGNQIPPEGNPQPQPSGDDGVATVQVIRTLSAGRFTALDGISEKGILEAYLRAFESARKYIYLENQYFTDAIITDALKTVLKRSTDLELILLINIKPDVPFYPRRQARLIGPIRAAAPDRVGVFTRWSYAHDHSRPWVAPIYLHSKLAVVDDAWATIGSANLDGLSLDYNLLLSPLTFGETTATELNLSIVSGSPGISGVPPAERIRRRLWAEHLGLMGADDKPNPDHKLLGAERPARWLTLWKQQAAAALLHIKNGGQSPLPGFVLEYPEDAGGLDTPRRHLAKLDVPLDLAAPKVRPIGATRAFDFFSGRWKPPNREDFVGATRGKHE